MLGAMLGAMLGSVTTGTGAIATGEVVVEVPVGEAGAGTDAVGTLVGDGARAGAGTGAGAGAGAGAGDGVL